MREAPTELTEESIEDGVEKTPVPIIRPTKKRGLWILREAET